MITGSSARLGPEGSTRPYWLLAVFLLTVFLLLGSSWSSATVNVSRAHPDAPIPSAPDLALVEDARLLELYAATVHGLRALWEIEDEAARTAAIRNFLDTPIPEEGIAYAVESARTALLESEPDWNRYRVALHATRFGESGDARFVELARMVFEMPRSGKVSEFESWAIIDTYRVLDNSTAPEAADLLWEAVAREFWGDEPFTGRLIGEPYERCLAFLRANALGTLTRIPPEHSLPVLEALKAEYPDVVEYNAPEDEFVFEYGAGILVDQALRQVYRRVGIDPDAPTREEGDAP